MFTLHELVVHGCKCPKELVERLGGKAGKSTAEIASAAAVFGSLFANILFNTVKIPS
jgi:hypothetical protein